MDFLKIKFLIVLLCISYCSFSATLYECAYEKQSVTVEITETTRFIIIIDDDVMKVEVAILGQTVDSVTVFTNNGIQVIESNPLTPSCWIDISSLANGTYLIVVSNNSSSETHYVNID